MEKTVPLRKNYEFTHVYKRGKYYASKHLVFYVMKNKLDVNRVGISVSKKVGKAVKRNRIRRLIKENFRLMEGSLKKGYDIVIVSRKTEDIPDFYDIRKEMNFLLRKHDLFEEEAGTVLD